MSTTKDLKLPNINLEIDGNFFLGQVCFVFVYFLLCAREDAVNSQRTPITFQFSKQNKIRGILRK